MASNWPSRSPGQNGLTPRIFTHSSFRPRFLFNETTMRALNPLTVYAVILLKKPIHNCIVRDTILRSGARSSLLTRANRNTASRAMPLIPILRCFLLEFESERQKIRVIEHYRYKISNLCINLLL